jgi:hypothetical protein
MSHEIQNISSTGFYLLTEERWHLGTIITMTLQRTSPASEKSPEENHISVRSKVVRIGTDGVGFAFIPQEPETDLQTSGPAGKKAIIRFIDRLNSDRGHEVIKHVETVLKTKLAAGNPTSPIAGEPYEEPEG